MRIHRALIISLLLTAAGGTAFYHAGPDEVGVVATVPNLGSIASAIGGERIDLTVIASGTQDPHFVDPKPSFIVRLRKAELLLVNGLDLEIGWIPPLIRGARTARLMPGGSAYVDCSAGIHVIEIPSVVSRRQGDVHPYGNPHYLLDPLNAEIIAGTIASVLKRIDPGSTDAYEEGRREFVEKLHRKVFGAELVELVGGRKLSREALTGTLDRFLDETSIDGTPIRERIGGWLGKMRPVRGQPVITYHRDMSYFARRFGLRVIDFVEPKPGIQPSARHLEGLLVRFERGDARVILTRTYVEHRSTDYLAKKSGATVVILPLEVGGVRGVTDYFELFDDVTDRILEGFAGAGDPDGR